MHKDKGDKLAERRKDGAALVRNPQYAIDKLKEAVSDTGKLTPNVIYF